MAHPAMARDHSPAEAHPLKTTRTVSPCYTFGVKGGRFAITVLAALSGLLFLIVAVSTSQNLNLHFSRRGSEWEITCRDNRLRLGNQPQVKLEAERRAALATEIRRASESREAPLRQILKDAPWGSPQYQDALNELKRLRHGGPNEGAPQPTLRVAVPTAQIEYSLPLAWLMVFTAILPVGIVLFRIVKIIGTPLPHRISNEASCPLGSNLRAMGAVIAALLLIVMAVMWVRSLLITDRLIYNTRSPAALSATSIQLWSLDGSVKFVHSKSIYVSREMFYHEDPANISDEAATTSNLPLGAGLHYWSHQISTRAPQRPSVRNWLGFGLEIYPRVPVTGTALGKLSWLIVTVPHWFLVLLSAIVPSLWLRRRMRALRAARLNVCVACGYDLRATPLRCPECGTVQRGAIIEPQIVAQ